MKKLLGWFVVSLLLASPAAADNVFTCMTGNMCGYLTSLTSGTTVINGATSTYVCFADGSPAVLNCASSGLTYTKASGTLLATVLTSGTLRIPNSITLPATCTVGDSYMDTDATSGQRWYLCESTNTWAAQGSSAPFIDSTAIIKGSGDASKLLKIEVDGLTTATTRTMTVPDADFTAAGLTLNQSWSGLNKFDVAGGAEFWVGTSAASYSASLNKSYLTFNGENSPANTDPLLYGDASSTPHGSLFIGTGTSNTVHIMEVADVRAHYDFQDCDAGTAAATDPGICGHSHNQSTGEWWSIRHNGSNTAIKSGTGLVGIRHLGGSGSAPAVSNTTANSCGTTAATIAGTDTAGRVTIGATLGTSCTVTFAAAFVTAPVCLCTEEGVGNCTAISTTTTTILTPPTGAFNAGDTVVYQCLGY